MNDRDSLLQLLQDAIKKMHPAYFAMVMATGIVCISSQLLGFKSVALLLHWLNVLFFLTLWLLTLIRFVSFNREFIADLTDHSRGVGFFTVIAGTCVLGSQFVVVVQNIPIAMALWILGISLWVVFIYTILTAFTIKETKPPLEKGLNGGWLVIVVATQSVSNLGSILLPHLAQHQDWMIFTCLSLWLCGGMIYIWVISLIFYRYTFFLMSPTDLMPPYWINMGAMAISTLAGTALIANAPISPFLTELLPFLKGFTIFFWATATWWIPMLIVLGFWRHVYKKVKLTYDPLYWGAVFPLGMYTACTFKLALSLNQEYLLIIPRIFIYVAFAAWIATFTGLILKTLGTIAQQRQVMRATPSER